MAKELFWDRKVELESLKESLRQAPALLKPEGRLVIISFHSLEDKIVKDLRRAPALKEIAKSPGVPSSEEIDNNPSARSAKIRIYEKL